MKDATRRLIALSPTTAERKEVLLSTANEFTLKTGQLCKVIHTTEVTPELWVKTLVVSNAGLGENTHWTVSIALVRGELFILVNKSEPLFGESPFVDADRQQDVMMRAVEAILEEGSAL
jgi:hypothetical protein